MEVTIVGLLGFIVCHAAGIFVSLLVGYHMGFEDAERRRYGINKQAKKEVE